MALIPKIRLRLTFCPFDQAAVDYAGPLTTVQGRGVPLQKRWLCLFTCLSTCAVHTGEKPHTCLQCDKHFTTKSNLNRHLKAHKKRGVQRMFTCSKTLHNLALFNAHIRTAHQQPTTTAATRKHSAAKPVDAPPAKKI